MHIPLFLLTALTAVLACSEPVPLNNGGFEGEAVTVPVHAGAKGRLSGAIAAGWKDNSEWADLEARYAVDVEVKRDGRSAQRVELLTAQGGSPQLLQEFEALPGMDYLATVWVCATAPVPVNLLVRQSGAPYALRGRHQVMAGPQWQQLQVAWTSPAGERTSFILNPEQPGTVWFDAAALTLTPPAVPAAPPGEELGNAGFEDGFVPIRPAAGRKAKLSGEIAAGWSDDSAWAEVELRYAADREVKRGGKASQRLQIRAIRSGQVQFVQNLALRAGRRYSASLWVRGSTPAPLQLNIRQGPSPYRGYASTQAVVTPEWQHIGLSWTQPEDAAGMLMLVPTTPATLWIDDASVTDITGRPDPSLLEPAHPGNLLADGSFEAGMGNLWNQAWSGDAVAWGTSATVAGGTHGGRALRLAVEGRTFRVHTAPVQAVAGRSHVFSVALRASKPLPVELKLGEGNSRMVQVGTEWSRYSVAGRVGSVVHGWISVIESGHGGDLDIDAAQIEEGVTPSDYRPRFPHELVLSGGGPGRIVAAGGVLRLTPIVAPAPPSGSRLLITVGDLAGRIVQLPPLAWPAAEIVVPAVPLQPHGTWQVEARVVAADGTPLSDPASLTFSRLPAPRTIDAATSFFGIHLPFNAGGIAIATATGQHWLRAHDAASFTKWGAVEPEQDRFAFDDTRIDAARAAGLRVLGLLDGAPWWASTGPRRSGYFANWHLPDVPEADALWTRYVDRTVRHYAGRIDDWEVWNEAWSTTDFFPKGTPQRYAELLKLAHAAAKQANPRTTIVGVNTAGNQEAFTTPVLAAAGTAFDQFSWHEYNVAPGGGWPAAIHDTFAAMMRDHGGARPQLVTEGGNAGQLIGMAGGASRELALASAAWIVRVDAEMLAAGIIRHFWYSAHFTTRAGVGSFSAIEHDGAIKPAFAARAVLAWLIDAASCDGLTTDADSGMTRVAFRQTDGRRITVVWSAYGDRLPLAVPASATLLDLFGNPQPAAGAIVDATPSYLVE